MPLFHVKDRDTQWHYVNMHENQFEEHLFFRKLLSDVYFI